MIISLGASLLTPMIAVSQPRLTSTQITKLTEEVTELYLNAESLFPGVTGIVDITYGVAEQRRFNTITGSEIVGFNFPCLVACAYLELAGNAYGSQWISGEYQKVPGGSGLLGALYNYLEPTGRFPIGNKFKIVVWDVNEGEGTAEIRAYTRVCKPLPIGCTPFTLPPGGISLGEVAEKDTIFVGLILPEL